MRPVRQKEVCTVFLDKIALALAVIGGLNWGCIGLFNFDLVAFILSLIHISEPTRRP